MKKNNIIILYGFLTVICFLNFNLFRVFAIVDYEAIDKKIIPLLIPPYSMINESLNHSEIQGYNLTYIKNLIEK